MMASKLTRAVPGAIIVVALAFCGPGRAGESAATVALARELIVLKGSTQLWDAVVPGVIEQVKAVFLQTNPALSKELNEVAGRLRAEYAPRSSQLILRFYVQ